MRRDVTLLGVLEDRTGCYTFCSFGGNAGEGGARVAGCRLQVGWHGWMCALAYAGEPIGNDNPGGGNTFNTWVQ